MTKHPYSDRRQSISGPDWNGHEKSLAKKFGGKRTPGSGSVPVPGMKGDVQTKTLHIEAKCTAKRSYTLRQDDLAKLQRQAFENGKTPVFCIKFEAPKNLYGSEEWALIPLEILKGILDDKREDT